MIGVTDTAQAASNGMEVLTLVISFVAMLWGARQHFKAAEKSTLLKAAIVGVQAALDAISRDEAELAKQKIKEQAKAIGGEELHQALKAEVRRTTVERAAYKDDPPPPPRLGGILLVVVASLALAGGCVSQAARDLAVAHKAHLIAFDGASQPHASYLVDDTEPGPDGKKLTAAEKIAAWKRAREEVLLSAHELAEALR